jgi:hypothetical protein
MCLACQEDLYFLYLEEMQTRDAAAASRNYAGAPGNWLWPDVEPAAKPDRKPQATSAPKATPNAFMCDEPESA